MDQIFKVLLVISIFVISTIIVIILARRYNLNNLVVRLNKHKRIAIEEVTILGSKRRLVLIRRDNILHLVLIGDRYDLIIEKNIPLIRSND